MPTKSMPSKLEDLTYPVNMHGFIPGSNRDRIPHRPAERGEIDPWDVKVIDVIDRFLQSLKAQADTLAGQGAPPYEANLSEVGGQGGSCMPLHAGAA